MLLAECRCSFFVRRPTDICFHRVFARTQPSFRPGKRARQYYNGYGQTSQQDFLYDARTPIRIFQGWQTDERQRNLDMRS